MGFLFIFSLFYYGIVFIHEFCAAARVRRTIRQLMWAKIRANRSKIRGMGSIVLKGHKKKMASAMPGKNSKVSPLKSGFTFDRSGQKSSGGQVNLAKVVPFKGQNQMVREMVKWILLWMLAVLQKHCQHNKFLQIRIRHHLLSHRLHRNHP